MAKDMESHFLRFGLIAVFTVAMLTILGIVALVLRGPGVQVVSAAENTAGQAHGILTGEVYRYRAYDVYGRVVTLIRQSGETIQVAVGPEGAGTLICQGKRFGLAVADPEDVKSTLLVDRDADGSYDAKINQGEFFTLACGNYY